MKKKISILIFAGWIAVISSCYNDKEALLYPTDIDCNNPAQRGPKFSQVQQMCQNQCVSCHGAGGTFPDLSKDCNIVSKWESISVRCNTTDVSLRMPLGGQLSATDLQNLNDWVAAGHKFND